MAPKESAFVQIGPWRRGANNVAEEDSIPNDQVRLAQNIDFRPDGKIRSRQGRQKVATLAGACNFWSDGFFALVQAEAELYRFIPGVSPIPLYSGFAVDTYNAYCSVNQYVYASDGHIALRVSTFDNSVREWGLPTPGSPIPTATTNGGMAAGTYQVTMTWSTADGEESGSSLAATVDVPADGGISLQIPAAIATYITTTQIYMSTAGGEELFFYAAVPVGTTQVQLYKQALGKPLDTFGLVQFPACDFVGLAMGRLFGVPTANPDCVIWSEPTYYGQYNPAKNYVRSPYTNDLLAPTSLGAKAEGIFVATGNRTYFQGGNQPGDFTNNEVYMAGAVRGSLVYIPGSYFSGIQGVPPQPLPVWIATNGTFCLGMPTGSVLPLTEGRFAAAIGARGNAMYREYDGVRQALFSVEPPAQTLNIVAKDSMTTTLVRNGIEI